MEKINEMKELLESLECDCEKFYENGNKSAGTRIRKVMQEVKALAQVIRKEVQELKNGE